MVRILIVIVAPHSAFHDEWVLHTNSDQLTETCWLCNFEFLVGSFLLKTDIGDKGRERRVLGRPQPLLIGEPDSGFPRIAVPIPAKLPFALGSDAFTYRA